MEKITNQEILKSNVKELYDSVRTAMVEKVSGFSNRRLERSYSLLTHLAKMNGVQVTPLPIPKSSIQGAPELKTKAATTPKMKTAPKVPGDLIADNAKKTRKRRTTKKQ